MKRWKERSHPSSLRMCIVGMCALAHTNSIHTCMHTNKIKTKTIHNPSLLFTSTFPTGHEKGSERGLGCEQEGVGDIGAGAQGLGSGWRVRKRVTDRLKMG